MDLALALEDSTPFKLTIDQYQALDEAGAFAEQNGRVELIEGMIVCMSPQVSAHGFVAAEIAFRLRERLRDMGSPLTTYVGTTVAIPPHNAPDPDVAVAPRQADKRYISPDATVLLVEVSNTSLRRDMTIKRDVYARAGVPEYWVVDINKRLVHRFWRAGEDIYRVEEPIALAGELPSLTMPGLAIDGVGIL